MDHYASASPTLVMPPTPTPGPAKTSQKRWHHKFHKLCGPLDKFLNLLVVINIFHNIGDELMLRSASGNKRYTFETSHQMLTPIYTTRLTPCCTLFFVYNSVLFIVECLKWGMHVSQSQFRGVCRHGVVFLKIKY